MNNATRSLLNARAISYALGLSLLGAWGLANAQNTPTSEVSSGASVEASDTANTEMEPVMIESIERYKGCIEGVMSTQESASVKREQIVTQCEGYHQDMAAFFAPEVREFVMTNNNRRIAAVLDALESMEAVVDDSVEDAEIITSEVTDEDMGEAVTATDADG